MTDNTNTNTNAVVARRARQWAKDAKAAPNAEYSVETLAAIEFVLANTDEPTMADVEWDWNEHCLAGATLPSGTKVVMIRPSASSSDHITTDIGDKRRDYLTPTGERYKLVNLTEENETTRADEPGEPNEPDEPNEPNEPNEPKSLVTEEDYENAPEGTIVAKLGGCLWQKRADGDWHLTRFCLPSHEMAGTERRVLRWGPEE